MSANTLPRPRLLTAAEYAELPEDNEARYELQEGSLVMSPRPRPDHQECVVELLTRLRAQLSRGLDILPEIDIDLELAAPNEPGFVRISDLVVAPREARLRVRTEGGLIRASEVLLVIEIASPGSRRIDTVIKRGEYADAGIAHYWVVDVGDDVALTTYQRDAGGSYVATAPYTGVVTLDEPFRVRLDLDALL